MEDDRKFQYVFTTFVALSSAAIGAFVTVALDKNWDRLIPIGKAEIEVKNDNRISKDHPPFVFSYERIGHYEPQYGIFGLTKIPTGWVYELKMANLTNDDVRNVSVEISISKTPDYWIVRNYHHQIYQNPSNRIPEGTQHVIENKKNKIIFFVPTLPSRRSETMEFSIFTKQQPTRSDINIEMLTPNGRFTEYSPYQYESIGWEEKSNKSE